MTCAAEKIYQLEFVVKSMTRCGRPEDEGCGTAISIRFLENQEHTLCELPPSSPADCAASSVIAVNARNKYTFVMSGEGQCDPRMLRVTVQLHRVFGPDTLPGRIELASGDLEVPMTMKTDETDESCEMNVPMTSCQDGRTVAVLVVRARVWCVGSVMATPIAQRAGACPTPCGSRPASRTPPGTDACGRKKPTVSCCPTGCPPSKPCCPLPKPTCPLPKPCCPTGCPPSKPCCPLPKPCCPLPKPCCPLPKPSCPLPKPCCPTGCPPSKPCCPLSKPCCPLPKPCCPLPKPCCPLPKPCCPLPKPCCPLPKPCCPLPKPCCSLPKPCRRPCGSCPAPAGGNNCAQQQYETVSCEIDGHKVDLRVRKKNFETCSVQRQIANEAEAFACRVMGVVKDMHGLIMDSSSGGGGGS